MIIIYWLIYVLLLLFYTYTVVFVGVGDRLFWFEEVSGSLSLIK